MRLIIQENKDDVGEWVATYVMNRINEFAPTAERPFVIGALLLWVLSRGVCVLLTLFLLRSAHRIHTDSRVQEAREFRQGREPELQARGDV